MHFLVTYDVATESDEGRRRLRRVAQVCLNYGQRVQKSVFEVSVTEAQYEQMRRQLLACIEASEDSLRIYRLREPKELYIFEYGVNRAIDFNDPLIV